MHNSPDNSKTPGFPRSRAAAILPLLSAVFLILGIAIAIGPPRAAVATTTPASTPAPAPAKPKPFANRCDECHRMDAAFSHPTGMRPQITVPSHLPLDEGKLTCTTCHLPTEHDRAGNGSMLRPTVGAESFCAECHTASKQTSKQAHASATDRAHLRTKKPSTQSNSPATPGRLDAESIACMSCHDGASAPDIGSHLFESGFSPSLAKEHPIGVAYKAGRPGSSEISLVAPSSLDPRVRLFDQSVGCGSCHSVYSKQDRLLVMSNVRSRLCLACHVE